MVQFIVRLAVPTIGRYPFPLPTVNPGKRQRLRLAVTDAGLTSPLSCRVKPNCRAAARAIRRAGPRHRRPSGTRSTSHEPARPVAAVRSATHCTHCGSRAAHAFVGARFRHARIARPKPPRSRRREQERSCNANARPGPRIQGVGDRLRTSIADLPAGQSQTPAARSATVATSGRSWPRSAAFGPVQWGPAAHWPTSGHESADSKRSGPLALRSAGRRPNGQIAAVGLADCRAGRCLMTKRVGRRLVSDEHLGDGCIVAARRRWRQL